jgi:hypothetical protein
VVEVGDCFLPVVLQRLGALSGGDGLILPTRERLFLPA